MKSGSALHQPPSPLSSEPKSTSSHAPVGGGGGDFRKVCESSPLGPVPAGQRDAKRTEGRPGLRGPLVGRRQVRRSLPPDRQSQVPLNSCQPPPTLWPSSWCRTRGPGAAAGRGAGRWRDSGRGRPAWPLGADPAYPGGESALGRAVPAGSPSGPARAWGPREERVRLRVGAGGSGARARGLAGPGQSVPRHVAARAEGSAGRAGAGPRRRRLPGRGGSGLGCAGLSERGRRPLAGRGRRRRWREARRTGRAGEAVSA